MMYPNGFDGKCVILPKDGDFTIGHTYHFQEHQTNDIVFITCNDDSSARQSFYEWSGFNRYFRQI